MNIVNFKIEDLIPYENNPRINDDAVEYVKNSIKEFGFKVPIVIDKNNVIVAGHTRYKACKELGINEIPCIVADDLTDEQVKAFRLADNKVSEKSQWDLSKLDEELGSILDIDMSMFDFNPILEAKEEAKYVLKGNGKMNDKYIIPPFSVFDARQGYWQERKRWWINQKIESGLGRKEDLLPGFKQLAQATHTNLSGTSIFDPVLCEVIYKWFNIDAGSIFDPFAGGSVRGIVAEKLGYKYTGIDLRQEQIDANIKQAEELKVNPCYICDDSLNLDKHINDESVDLIFSCPPYGNLEKYSDDPKDLSNMEYEDFKKAYFEIISKACKTLKNDRFACFVVGDIRDKNGAYYNFVDDTKKAFLENGLCFYNEIILVNALGTSALRANRLFVTRKMVKTHQNVLIFYKGDIKKIKENYKKIDVIDIVKGFENTEEENDRES